MIKLKYIPGIRPTPMLAYYTKKDVNVFNELKDGMNAKCKCEYNENGDHYWNMNAYIIIENNEINSIVFAEFIYAIWLLRVVNKDIIINIPDEYLELIKDDLEQLKGEIEQI